MMAKKLREKLDLPQKVVVLAEEKFNKHSGKTARALIKYSDLFNVVGVLDSCCSDKKAGDIITDLDSSKDTEIYSSLNDCLEEKSPESLVIGVSPAGGELPKKWINQIKTAINEELNIISGLHVFLSDNKELKKLSIQKDVELIDLRKPPSFKDLKVADGEINDFDNKTVLVLGTDCAVGKMTTTYKLYKEALERGFNAAWVATGQTGILCGAQRGIVVDRVPSDFASGVVEEIISSLKDKDLVFVEGQGSIYHRAYSGVAVSILHGSNPDAIVLAHDPSREKRPHFPRFKVQDIEKEIRAIEELSDTEVCAINTWSDKKQIKQKTGLLTKNIKKDGVKEIFIEIKNRIME